MITVLTPTYNRGYIISELYQSLKRQTMKNFEWIIVDDGSTDNTEQLVSDWMIEKNAFDIYYIKQQNGGKHRAWNTGVKYASGKYIFVVDSDDYLSDDAIEKANVWIKDIDENEKYAGVGGLKVRKDGNENWLFLKNIQNGCIDATQIECRKLGLPIDKAEIVRTDLMKKYPLPVFENEKFISEGAFWQRLIKEGYTFRWHMDAIYFYEYLNDGLTKSNEENIKNNWKGYTYVTKLSIQNENIITKIGILLKYIKLAKEKKLSSKEIANGLECKILWVRFLKIASDVYFRNR